MASTRNKNTPGNYKLEQLQYRDMRDYSHFINSQWGESYNTSYAGDGVLQGKLPMQKMSSNPIQIESFLFGINSTNLVKPEAGLVPELKTMNTLDFYKKPATTIMPLPLVIERNRPFPCP